MNALALSLLLAAAHPAENRITNHLIIHDYPSACLEAEQAFAEKPSVELFELYIEALAKQGNEAQLWAVWNKYSPKYPEVKQKREVLEQIAWGVLTQGVHSSSPLLRVQGLIAAYFAQDAKGVALLLKGMHDNSAMVRRVAIKLSASMRDAKLQDQVQAALKDKNYDVRLAAIAAVGGMHLHAAKGELLRLLALPAITPEETEAAVAALVEMTEAMDRGEIERLIQSPRYGLRLLGCGAIRFLESKRDIDLIQQLVNDPQPIVRAAALRTLGLLRAPGLGAGANSRLNDNNPAVAITAAWGLTLEEPEKGQSAFLPWLSHDEKEVRHLAAAALSATGKHGLSLQKKTFYKSSDPFVRMNLAMGLICQREDVGQACRALAEGLSANSEKWELAEESDFKILRVSQVRQDEAPGNSKEAQNQLARLQILNILAIMQYPETAASIRDFLKERAWGISGMASALLLSEGDESALDRVEELINDEDRAVRTQAALILALWGRSEKAIQTLEKGYAEADREMKEHILEGIGRVGSLSSVPFLLERLQEPFQSLRIIAAAALLECLYH